LFFRFFSINCAERGGNASDFPMRVEYAKERIKFFDNLPGNIEAIHSGALCSISPEGLRFKHGHTIAELKVPYHLGSDDEAVCKDGVLGLAALIRSRYESLKQALKEADSPREGGIYVKIPQLREKTLRLDIFAAQSFERALAARILENTPYVDSAVLYAWLSPGESGHEFVKWLRAILKKARSDELRHGQSEHTSYLTLLALIKTMRKHQKNLKDFRIQGLAYDKLDLAVGLTFFHLFCAIIEELTGGWSENDGLGVVLRSALLPEHFLSVRSGILNTSHNPYGLSMDTLEALRPLMVPLTDNIESMGLLVTEGVKRVRNDKAVLRAVIRQIKLRRFRQKALEYMKSFDVPDIDLRKELSELYNEDRLISNLIKDGRKASTLAASLEAQQKVVEKDHDRAGKLGEIRAIVLELSKKRSLFGGFAGGGKEEENAEIASVLEGYYAFVLDEMVKETVDLMMDILVDRRLKLSNKMLRDEYLKGQIYRFSTDKRAMIKTLHSREEGQLFVDMKDFTRKTHNVKELAMADFMKEYFFKPILDAAGGYTDGEGFSEDEMGIRLTNIPGDAIIFSGGMRRLVALAHDIQRIISESGKALERRLPPGSGREALEGVHQRFEERKAAIRKKRLETITGIGDGKEDSAEAILRIGEEESRLERIYKDELAAAIKHEMEAGLFITYGARAEVIDLGFSRGYKGPVNVSIGEKINEASRGTFRHPMVKAFLEILLSGERERRRNRELKYPFDVYIHTAYTLRMPPEIEHAFEKLISGQKLSNARALTRLITENYLKDFEKIIAGESFSELRLITSITDIYNKGQALSDEALGAYIKESRGEKSFLRKIICRDDLHESIKGAFFLPQERMEFIYSANLDKAPVELFYRAGELIFRGFEAEPPREVYEMLNPEGEFFAAIKEHHLKDWIEEAREAGEEPL